MTPDSTPPPTPEADAQKAQQPPPPSKAEPSPADKIIEAEGGDIIPPELGGLPTKTFEALKPTPAPEGTPAPAAPVAPKPVVLEGVRGVLSSAGPRPPGMAEAPATSAEGTEIIKQIDAEINFELNVLHMCYGATRNLIDRLRAGQPPDVAEFAQFEGGKRTPLELAEPQMALEVYRQVRDSLRFSMQGKAAPPAPKDALSVIGEGLNDALVVLAGRKK